jgi:hypothetical protein
MSEQVRLTQAQFELLVRISAGQTIAYDAQPLQTLVAKGFVVAMRIGRGKVMGVSITHRGRARVLGQNSNQVVE